MEKFAFQVRELYEERWVYSPNSYRTFDAALEAMSDFVKVAWERNRRFVSVRICRR